MTICILRSLPNFKIQILQFAFPHFSNILLNDSCLLYPLKYIPQIFFTPHEIFPALTFALSIGIYLLFFYTISKVQIFWMCIFQMYILIPMELS